jgi:alpha-glucosidase
MDEWWRGAAIYQIYPRSFQDSNGDGIGDLPGIVERLPHVADLGADAIWLSPFFPSPMDDMGYDVADYRGVDPMFGSLEDFDALVETAHRLGLKVMIDQVLSHSSSRHPWFEQSRQSRTNDKADWYVWADAREDGTPPTNWLALFGGPAWEWEPRRRQYYLHHFLVSQPDLNFHEPAVQDEMIDTLRFWLERGVDGFRLDVVNFYHHDHALRDDPPDPDMVGVPWTKPYDAQLHLHSKTQAENIAFLGRMRRLTDAYGAALMGEVVEGPRRSVEIMADYTRGTDRLHMAYSFELLGDRFGPKHLRDVVGGYFGFTDDGWPAWAFSNHDVPRHRSRWAEHGDVAHQAAALLLSLRGSVCMFQGEEAGQTQTDLERHEITDPEGKTFWPVMKGRDGCRTPMVWDETRHGGFTTGDPWLPVKPPQVEIAVSRQVGVEGSVLETYRAMLAFRRETPQFRRGGLRFVEAPPPALAYLRDDILCLFQLGADATRLRVAGAGRAIGPAGGRLDGDVAELAPNGWLFLEVSGDVAISAA